MSKTLANGAPISKETWDDFVKRLHHDIKGEGVRDHYTADAVFLVQKRVWLTVPEGCGDCLRVVTDGHDEALDSFIKDLEPEVLASLNEAVDGVFAEACSYEMAEALAKVLPDSTLYHSVVDWETVNQHFTKDAAEAFIKRKGHDYREGLRVYVDCSCYSWELNTLKEAILSGQIGFIEQPTAH